MPKPPPPIKIGSLFDSIYPAYALMAALQLDVFSCMEDGAKSAEQIATDLAVTEEKLSVLLNALVAAGLLTIEDSKFANTEETGFYLVKNSPAYFGDIHGVLSGMWRSLVTTAESIRLDAPQAAIDYYEDEVPDDMQEAYSGMHKLSMMSSRDLMKRFDLSQHKHIADIGGGSGGLSIALTQALPELEATVIDLKAAIAFAEQYTADVPQKDRINLVVHNIVDTPYRGQFDAAVMRAFTQVLSREQNSRTIKHTFDALKPGGCLYILTQIVDDTGVKPASAALINLVFLNVYEGGRAFTESDYRVWLREAGFTEIEFFLQKRGDSIIKAVKPN